MSRQIDSSGRVKRSRIRSQTKNVIMNVYHHFKHQWGALSVSEVDEMTAKASGVCVRTVRSIKAEAALCFPLPISSPTQRVKPPTINSKLDNFESECIRKEILSFYNRGELPTLVSLLAKVKQPPINYKGGRCTLWKAIRVGFRFKKYSSGRAMLMERQDITTSRNRYLRVIEQNRKSTYPRPEIYLDETWINQNECIGKCWTVKDGTIGPKTKSGKGARFIILHAGGETGFVPNALLFFRSKNGNKGDYHEAMDHNRFKRWFEEQLVPNLTEGSLIIMDNASYHSRIINKVPTCSSKKHEVIDWLTKNHIDHDPSFTKVELLEISKRNKHRQKYEIDELAAYHGHEILRLPPYHCQLNPIELIWAKIKTEIKKGNSNANQTLKQVEELTIHAIENITENEWKNCIHHTKKEEDEYRKKDLAREHLIEDFIVTLNSSDDSSSDDNSGDEEMDIDVTE